MGRLTHDVECLSAAATGQGRAPPASPICCLVSHPGHGRSLFVNVSPRDRRVCSFDCIFCAHPRPSPDSALRWPTPGEIGSALANRSSDLADVESITISGRGEPTLHPRFGAVVAEVLAYADRVRPGLPVRILTNGSQLRRPLVRRLLDYLDQRLVKLDAARDRVNRPTADVSESVAALPELRDTILLSCFVDGACSNCDPESVSRWMQRVVAVNPRAVRIHTIQPEAATVRMWPVSQAHLRQIERELRSGWSIDTEVLPWIPRSFPARKHGD
jgi:wyosine [tRNA(Phe)-imidazoG37] synthetase (radical SAM superfamily)